MLRETKRFLISGTRCGLGKYLHTRLGGKGVARNTSPGVWAEIRRQSFDAIIHCAAAAPRNISFGQLAALFEDNVMLTARLLECKCKYFVYISSIAVYSSEPIRHREDEKLSPEKAQSLYALTKMISESLVQKSGVNHLILRPCSLIGKESRMNNIMSLIKEPRPRLTLAADSRYNLVYYPDIADLIEHAIRRRVTGAINVASSKTITLAEMAEIAAKRPVYGNYRHDAGSISNAKAVRLLPAFKQTSRQVFERFLETL